MSNLTDTDLLAVEVKVLARWLETMEGLAHAVQIIDRDRARWRTVAAFGTKDDARAYVDRMARPDKVHYRIIETGMEPHRT